MKNVVFFGNPNDNNILNFTLELHTGKARKCLLWLFTLILKNPAMEFALISFL